MALEKTLTLTDLIFFGIASILGSGGFNLIGEAIVKGGSWWPAALGISSAAFMGASKVYEKAFDGIPVRLVGHNPNMPGVRATNSWDHLKRMLQSHRFYIHTANPELEDGYNLASLEAMAAGMPVLGNRHPTSPIEHSVSGFLSDDPAELCRYANMLLEDKILATMMGREARKTVIEQFSMTNFKEAFLKSIETARQKWKHRKLNR